MFFNFLKKLYHTFFPAANNNEVIEDDKSVKLLSHSVSNTSFPVYLNDPTTPDLTTKVKFPSWKPLWPTMKFEYLNSKQTEFRKDTPEWQAAQAMWFISQAFETVQEAELWKSTARWPTGKPVLVRPRAGNDFNAFYDRRTLSFFYGQDKANTVFTVESLDIVSHETGHAILDIMRPELYSMQALEVWAYHEAFADIIAILTSLSFSAVVDSIQQETSGDFKKSNVVSRVGEELGAAIYRMTKGKDGRVAGYLRNAVNDFKYVIPEKLPANALDNQLASEPHSFARVFVGAFYDIIAAMVDKAINSGLSFADSINKARVDATKLIIKGTLIAPATPRFYDAVARSILALDRQNGGEYNDMIKAVFLKRNILNNKQVKMLQMKEINNDQSIVDISSNTSKLIRIQSAKTIKLSDHFGIKAQAENPLYECEIDVPVEEYMEVNSDGLMIDSIGTSQKLVVNSARECIKFLHKFDLVQLDSVQTNKPFKIENNKLTRNYFI